MERRNLVTILLVSLLAIAIGAGLGMLAAQQGLLPTRIFTPPVPRLVEPIRLPSFNAPSLAPVLKNSLPGVVNIATTGGPSPTNPLFNDPFFRRFFGLPPENNRAQRTQSVGSGVIVDSQNGYVLTNQHLISKADEIFVVLQDKRKLKATVVGSDPDTDIAVLKVEQDNLTALPLGNSDNVQVGDFVVAIGNPFGLGNTATFGIVSALERTGLGIEGYENFIQTDASINPGNSGGALVDLNGEVIGINTAILSGGEGNVGIGFAIPINMAHRIMDQLITHGKVSHGQIGVSIQDVTPELKSAMNLDVDAGAIVTQVIQGGPADKAGIQQGDVIVKFDGKDVASAAALRVMVGFKAVGDTSDIELIRKGQRKTVRATIGEAKPAENGEAKGVDLLKGATFSSLPPDNPMYGKLQGVLIVKIDPGSPAAFAGLQTGDIIMSVNQQPVSTIDQLVAAAKIRKAPLLLTVRRGNLALFIVVR
ncbi:MAG: DegQ family serine endoprotease [Alphaproteobacteria bacterium]|nr:DegQ family serine endoprotease [Alphaproteobacteria bacterium]